MGNDKLWVWLPLGEMTMFWNEIEMMAHNLSAWATAPNNVL